MRVSIIVPIYQAEKHLHKCIESIINQTYGELEILLIDDGSKDGSLELCKQYQAIDHRIKVLSQTNKGVSATRNRGIREATGDYILFVDSDDYIEKQMIEYMVEKAGSYYNEIVFCGFEYVYNQERIIQRTQTEEGKYNQEELVKNFWELYECGILHNIGTKLYSRDLLIRNNIFFDEKKNILEDIEFCLTAIRGASSFYVCDKSFYKYMMEVNPNSIQKLYRKDFYVYLQDLFHVIEEMGIDKNQKFYLIYMDALLLTLRNELLRDKKSGRLILEHYKRICNLDYVNEAKKYISIKDVRGIKYIFYLCIWNRNNLILYLLVNLWRLGEL